jgi:carboxyl-terminal processing protease
VNQKGRIIPTFFLFLLAIVFTFVIALKIVIKTGKAPSAFNYQKSLTSICQMVYEKHYLGRERLAQWHRECVKPRLGQNGVQSANDREAFIEDVRFKFAGLNTSHLEIYTPVEDKLTWAGESTGDNGLRLLPINGRFYVYKVLPDSSALAQGFRVGDQILSMDGQRFEVANFSKYSGPVEILRAARDKAGVVSPQRSEDIKLVINIEALPLKVDSSPVLYELNANTAWLEISSFRKEYIVNPGWDDLIQKANAYSSLAVDLRGNLGGDFNSVTRALSSFVCDKNAQFGELIKPNIVGPKFKVAHKSKMTNDTDSIEFDNVILKENMSEDDFYNLLVKSRSVALNRFDSAVCYKGRVTVLIDEDSASVSEIFAAVIKESLPSARVWGARSRGDMLLGVWYPIDYVGKGYTLSIPEAVYQTKNKYVVESNGVNPTRQLFYDENDIRAGRDSWLEASAK